MGSADGERLDRRWRATRPTIGLAREQVGFEPLSLLNKFSLANSELSQTISASDKSTTHTLTKEVRARNPRYRPFSAARTAAPSCPLCFSGHECTAVAPRAGETRPCPVSCGLRPEPTLLRTARTAWRPRNPTPAAGASLGLLRGEASCALGLELPDKTPCQQLPRA